MPPSFSLPSPFTLPKCKNEVNNNTPTLFPALSPPPLFSLWKAKGRKEGRKERQEGKEEGGEEIRHHHPKCPTPMPQLEREVQWGGRRAVQRCRLPLANEDASSPRCAKCHVPPWERLGEDDIFAFRFSSSAFS